MENDVLWQKAVQTAIVANVPCLIQGDPGIGKTSYIYALAGTLGCKPEVVIASLREPSDFLGLPVLHEGTVRMAAPQWATRLAEAGAAGMLVLDEITTAPPAVQAALLRVVLERVVGDLTLPREVRIVAIANPSEQAGGWDLSLPLSNRFFHIQAEGPSVKEWAVGLQEDWKTPPAIPRLAWSQENDSRAKALVGAFLTTRPGLLLQVPKDNSKDRDAWPSPRSWHNAATLLSVALSDKSRDLLSVVLSGTIGPGGAKEFLSWQVALDLPDPEDVLAKPHKFKVPDRLDKTFVILDGVASCATKQIKEALHAGQKPEAEAVWLAAWEVLGRVCDAGMPDVALVAAKRVAGVREESFTLPHKRIEAFGDLLRGIA